MPLLPVIGAAALRNVLRRRVGVHPGHGGLLGRGHHHHPHVPQLPGEDLHHVRELQGGRPRRTPLPQQEGLEGPRERDRGCRLRLKKLSCSTAVERPPFYSLKGSLSWVMLPACVPFARLFVCLFGFERGKKVRCWSALLQTFPCWLKIIHPAPWRDFNFGLVAVDFL